jgi:hypothetical protein
MGRLFTEKEMQMIYTHSSNASAAKKKEYNVCIYMYFICAHAHVFVPR